MKKFRKAGRNFVFDPGSTILTPDCISIGNDVFIGEYAHLSGDISIGDNVMVGPRPVINTGMDIFAIRGMSPRFTKPIKPRFYSPVVVENEVWIGANVTILGGVTIGAGAVIGAGSVVVRSVPPFTVAVGNPCRPIRRIFSDEVLPEHMREIGFGEDSIRDAVTRRKSELAGLELAVVDKTALFRNDAEDSRTA